MMKTLRELFAAENTKKVYFKSKVPFYNGGGEFMLYRVASEEELLRNEISLQSVFIDGFFVIPARYDSSGNIEELIPVEVFKTQHLDDSLFTDWSG